MKAVFVLTCALSTVALGESAIPSAYNRERYEQTFSDSPFAVATPKEEKIEEPANDPLSNLVVTGMGKLDDGRSFVIVQRVGDEGSMRFEGNEKNREGLSVKEVKWGEKWDKSIVVMSLEGRSKDIKFSEKAPVVAAAAVPPGGQRGPNPAVNAPPPIVPTGLNTAARTTPVQKQGSITPTIPRPGGNSNFQVPRPGGGGPPGSGFRGGQTLNQGNQPGTPQPTNGGGSRTRVRNINNR
jgi:hypothetical protein